MKKYALALATLVALVLSAAPSMAQLYRWESTNFPGMFIRHSNFNLILSKIETIQDQKDALFWQRSGLTGHEGSIESYNFPGFYVRHQNFKLVLGKNDETKLFKKDATFHGTKQPNGGYMLESVNFPGFFIRHKNFKLVLEKNDGSAQFLADASFRMRGREQFGPLPGDDNPPAPPPPPKTDQVTTRIATTIYDRPQGNDVAYLEKDESVTIISCTNEPNNNWCEISKPQHGFIFGDDLNL